MMNKYQLSETKHTFLHYYETTTEKRALSRRIKMTTQGHLMLERTDENFLCGRQNPTHEFREIYSWAMPGRKLCENCMSERLRIKNKLPTQDQLKNWWLNT